MTLRIAGKIPNSITDGPGLRFVIFAQGCKHNCPGCHNPQTHDFSGGYEVETADLAAEIMRDPLLSGVTFSGGEPFEQPEAFADLAEKLPGVHIIAYTGYTFEELSAKPEARVLLNKTDILVDGRFQIDKKTYDLKFRGSANQRVLGAKESVRLGEARETDF